MLLVGSRAAERDHGAAVAGKLHDLGWHAADARLVLGHQHGAAQLRQHRQLLVLRHSDAWQGRMQLLRCRSACSNAQCLDVVYGITAMGES